MIRTGTHGRDACLSLKSSHLYRNELSRLPRRGRNRSNESAGRDSRCHDNLGEAKQKSKAEFRGFALPLSRTRLSWSPLIADRNLSPFPGWWHVCPAHTDSANLVLWFMTMRPQRSRLLTIRLAPTMPRMPMATQCTCLHAYADRQIWNLLEKKLVELRATGARSISILDAGCGPGT
jgi:hypothetical protein